MSAGQQVAVNSVDALGEPSATGVDLFNFNGHQIRITLDDSGEPWFVAVDACSILGYTRVADAMRMLHPDDLGTHFVRGADGRDRPTQVIAESGLYDLAIGSKRPEAKVFKRWVTKEVLPAIRKTGTYSVPGLVPAQRPALPGNYLEALRELVSTVERADAAETKVAELEPKAAFADGFLAAKGDWSVRQMAHMLGRDRGINTGEIRLFRKLRELKWISKDNTPLQRHCEAGRITSKPSKSWGHPKTGERMNGSLQARITEKGAYELHRILGGVDPLALDVPDDEAETLFAIEGDVR